MNHINMAGMNPTNGTFSGMPPMNNGTTAGGPRPEIDPEYPTKLNTYIYDYFLKNEQYECARALVNSGMPIDLQGKSSPAGRRDGEVNGVDDNSMDTRTDADSKRPSDLPMPYIPGDIPDNSFLMDWFQLFWDVYFAQRKGKQASAQALQYVQHSQQQRMRQEHMLRQMPMMAGGMPNYNMMRGFPGNGMQMNPHDLQRKAFQNNRNAGPQQMAQIKSQQAQMMQQPMQRDGSDIDINGQRPHTPSSGDNAPSPSKRPRLEGGPFNGQQAMPNGRMPPQGFQGQVPQIANNTTTLQANQMLLQNGIDPSHLSESQFAMFQQANPQTQQKSIQVYAQNLAQHQRSALSNQVPKGMLNSGMPQGSPMLQGPGALTMMNDFNSYAANPAAMRGVQAANGQNGNHALQDYQMQLMLLEQQNKKRLMMARQEQETYRGPDGQPGLAGQQGFPTGTSPQGSRSGPSPGPSDQMKRGTPKPGQAGLPGGSPLPDGNMPQARGSPPPMFNSQMDPAIFQQMKMADMSGMQSNANGMRPPSSHPGFQVNGGPMSQPQMEALARAQAVGRIPGANWQQSQQGQQQMMPQPPPGQQLPQMGTPQQRNTAMPPPQAPPPGATNNGRPSPPQQANPPTPSQINKANPKGKKDKTEPRKRPTKSKSTANISSGATPSSEADNPPPTPTPSTPITPVHPNSFNQKGANGQNQAGNAQGSIPTGAPQSIAPPQPDTNVGAPMTFDQPDVDLTFSGFDTGDVLENFDFDSFLQNTDDHQFPFDAAGSAPYGNGDGVEASTGDV